MTAFPARTATLRSATTWPIVILKSHIVVWNEHASFGTKMHCIAKHYRSSYD